MQQPPEPLARPQSSRVRAVTEDSEAYFVLNIVPGTIDHAETKIKIFASSLDDVVTQICEEIVPKLRTGLQPTDLTLTLLTDANTAPLELTDVLSIPTAASVTLTSKSQHLRAADECRVTLDEALTDEAAARNAVKEANATLDGATEDAAIAAERLHEVKASIAGLEAKRRAAEDTYNDELSAFRRRGTLALEPTEKKAKKEAGSDNWPKVWLRAESGRLTMKLDGQPDSATAVDGGANSDSELTVLKQGTVEQELDKKGNKWAQRWWVLYEFKLLVFEHKDAAINDETPLHTIAIGSLDICDPKSKRKGRPGVARANVSDSAKIIVDFGLERTAWESVITQARSEIGAAGVIDGSQRAIVGDLRGCTVGRPKSVRKGYPHTFRLDLAMENSAGESKYIFAADTALAADGWIATLQNCSKYDSRSLLFSEQTCRNAAEAHDQAVLQLKAAEHTVERSDTALDLAKEAAIVGERKMLLISQVVEDAATALSEAVDTAAAAAAELQADCQRKLDEEIRAAAQARRTERDRLLAVASGLQEKQSYVEAAAGYLEAVAFADEGSGPGQLQWIEARAEICSRQAEIKDLRADAEVALQGKQFRNAASLYEKAIVVEGRCTDAQLAGCLEEGLVEILRLEMEFHAEQDRKVKRLEEIGALMLAGKECMSSEDYVTAIEHFVAAAAVAGADGQDRPDEAAEPRRLQAEANRLFNEREARLAQERKQKAEAAVAQQEQQEREQAAAQAAIEARAAEAARLREAIAAVEAGETPLGKNLCAVPSPHATEYFHPEGLRVLVSLNAEAEEDSEEFQEFKISVLTDYNDVTAFVDALANAVGLVSCGSIQCFDREFEEWVQVDDLEEVTAGRKLRLLDPIPREGICTEANSSSVDLEAMRLAAAALEEEQRIAEEAVEAQANKRQATQLVLAGRKIVEHATDAADFALAVEQFANAAKLGSTEAVVLMQSALQKKMAMAAEEDEAAEVRRLMEEQAAAATRSKVKSTRKFGMKKGFAGMKLPAQK